MWSESAEMKEVEWKRLLEQIRDGGVIPVLGAELLTGDEGSPSLHRMVAERLLGMHECEHALELPPCHELNAAVAFLKDRTSLENLYVDVHDCYRALTSASMDRSTPPSFPVPSAIRQLAEITDFRLFVTLTNDDLLAQCLRARGHVNEIVHSPKLPTKDRSDLPAGWKGRTEETQLLYIFGKMRPGAYFALHDEDMLEYAHNLIARGGNVPSAFMGELQEHNLLLIGSRFPDWLGRFFLRMTSKTRLALKEKHEWLIEQLAAEESLVTFLSSYSRDTTVLAQITPVGFVAELHSRWTLAQERAPREAALSPDAFPRAPMFFISYSRANDLSSAEALHRSLINLGVEASEIWFDRTAVEPGHNFYNRIVDGIRTCRYFLPLISYGVAGRQEAFVFREWREADDRRRSMRQDDKFVYPLVIDDSYEPHRYVQMDPIRPWDKLHFGHAPSGLPDKNTTQTLLTLVRQARRRD